MPEGGTRNGVDDPIPRPIPSRIFISRSNSGLFGELVPRPELHEHPLTVRLADAIDWKAALDNERKQRETPKDEAHREYYIVVFRSERLDSADDEALYAADALAHDEALASGGLLGYWYGILNKRRECLAMCIWESREQALAALRLPAHEAAYKLAEGMYKSYVLERYRLRAGDDGSGAPIAIPFSGVSVPQSDASVEFGQRDRGGISVLQAA